MKKQDLLWIAAVLAFFALILMEPSATYYRLLNTNHPYVAGFIKFAILSTLGNIMGNRITNNGWNKIRGLQYKALVNGFIGMMITLVFQIYSAGVFACMAEGYLPFKGSRFFFAFFTSLFKNMFFAPTFMAFHRFADTLIDMCYALKRCPTFVEVSEKADWTEFLIFSVCKTIPLFWIPAHTITFLLPAEHRVLFAALLSIVLGILLAYGKSYTQKKVDAK